MHFNLSSIGGGMRAILASLALMFLALQYTVWLGDFGYVRLTASKNEISA